MDDNHESPGSRFGWAKFWRRTKRGGAWASSRWYLAYLIPFEAAVVIIFVRGGDHNGWFWKALGIGLIVISMAAMAGNVLAVRKRRREGFVPIRSRYRPDVAGIRSTGQWRRPEREE